ncbi:MAG: tetratricopeptide repeat protein [Chloroflexota bacterium]|nr:tetratricopeptide repeat protein [Chloroflexota bacterium]
MPVNRVRADVLEMGDEYQKADYALQVRRYDLAIEIMRKVLSTHPDNSVAFVTLARAYALKKDQQQALQALQEALTLNPMYCYAHTLYGSLLKDMKRYAEARQEYRSALEIDPASHLAHYLYGDLLFTIGKDISEAREHVEKALELEPQDATYHLLLGHILAKQKDLEGAEAEYRLALSLEPDDYRVLNGYGAHLLTERNNPREAFEFFRQALMRSPDNANIRKNFLIALKAKHPLYSLFWNYDLLKRRSRPLAILFMLIVIALVRGLLEVGLQFPTLGPFMFLAECVLILLMVYLIAINPIFNFLAKRGLIR